MKNYLFNDIFNQQIWLENNEYTVSDLFYYKRLGTNIWGWTNFCQ